MKIVSSGGNEISSLEDWATLHRKRHWKEGRSAYSVADFVFNRGGTSYLESRLSEVLRQPVSLCLITPEKEIRFDGYGRGRVHDLGIHGIVGSDKTLFVGLEAKADEEFGPIMQDRYKDAEKELIKNPRSKAVERLRNLPAWFSPDFDLNSMHDIRYQLIHGTAGTVGARQPDGRPYDHYVFYVLVFKTNLFDEQVGRENHQDFQRFIDRIGGSDIEHPDVEAYSLTVNDKPLTCIYEHIEFPAVIG